jgi:hypothetical protein
MRPVWRRRLRFALVYAVFLFVLVEVTCRFFWWMSGVSFLACPNRIHHFWYPDLKELEPATRDDETFDILILGGSAVHPAFGDIPGRLAERLRRTSGRPLRVHCLAGKGHTSLDSFFKYRHLADRRFDLVLLYHGINDARANNCPEDFFRDDYSHWGWYKLVSDYEAKAGSRWLALPYTVHFSVIKLGSKLGLIPFVPKEVPGEEWLVHGASVKTARTFRANLGRIHELALERGDPLLVMTYAVDAGYENDARRFAIWGKPAHVTKAVAVHNDVVRELAQREGRPLADLDREMPRGKRYFGDPCHFTDEGAERFVDLLVSTLERLKLGPRTG